jgi:hypothetical protein
MDLNGLQILAQLVDSLEESSMFLEKAYKEKDLENFNKAKQEMLSFYKKISDIIR